MAGDIDFFGYERQKVGQQVFSSDYASVFFSNSGGGPSTPAEKAGLVQGAQVGYQHAVVPKFEGGSHELYWLTGQAMGSMSMSRLIGDNGLLDGVSPVADPNSLNKGLLGAIEYKVGRHNITNLGVQMPQDIIQMSGCIMQNYATSFSVAGLEVGESVTIQCALVKRGRRD